MRLRSINPLLAALLAMLLAAVSASAQKQPNVLFLSVDDLKPLIGAYGSTQVKTPNIDRLAARGTVMMNNYCQQAICAPSRMSMFTGLRPDSTKVWDLRAMLRDTNPSAVTMQQHFKNNGYETAGAGKIMHGSDPTHNHPPSWSVPYTNKKELPYASGYPVPAHDNAFYQGELEQKVYKELNDSGVSHWKKRWDWMRDRDAMPSTECLDMPDAAYVDGALAVWGSDMLEKFAQEGKPFFLTVGFCKPHLPFVAPKKYWDMYDRNQIDLAEFREHAQNSPDYAYHNFGELRSYTDIPDGQAPIDEAKQKELIHAYFACVSYVDAQIGKLLDKLDQEGLADNTIIVLWGDHGYHLGDHGMWNKHSNFEQATKAPLIFAAPGYKGNQKAEEAMTEFVDIFPTLCDLAGLEEPYDLEGDSLVPVMKDPASTVGAEYSVSQYPRWGGKLMGYSVRTKRYRLTVWMKDEWRTFMPFSARLVQGMELYDYEKDPLETVNVAQDPAYADVLQQHKDMILEYFKAYEEDPHAAIDDSLQRVKPAEDNEIVELSEVDGRDLTLRFAGIQPVAATDDLIVSFENNPKWPSIDFTPPGESLWNLSGYRGLEINLTNKSDQPVKTTAYITNPGDSHASKRRNGATEVMPPNATANLRVMFDPSEYPLELSSLDSLRIFVSKLDAPVDFQIHHIKAIN